MRQSPCIFPTTGSAEAALHDAAQVPVNDPLGANSAMAAVTRNLAAGEPGGTINLTRNGPTDEMRSAVSLAYGSWDNRRIEADIGGPIGFDGRLRGRVAGVWQDRDYFHAPADEEKQVLYGILEYDLTPDTTISGGVTYQHQYGTHWQTGLPTFLDGSQLGLPRNPALNPDWARRDTTIRETFFTAEHRINDDWSVKLNAMQQKYDFGYLKLNVGGPVDPATGLFGAPSVSSEDDGNHSRRVDLSVTGRFRAWGVDYKLTAGADWRMSEGKQIRNRYQTAFPDGELGPDDFPGVVLPEPTFLRRHHGWPAWGGKQQGIYARLDMALTDTAHVIVGGRYGNYKHRDIYELYDDNGDLVERDASYRWQETGIFTPYAAVNHDVTPGWSACASLTEIYKPQGNMFAGPPENPTQLDPITGRNVELGAKGRGAGRGAERLGRALSHRAQGRGHSGPGLWREQPLLSAAGRDRQPRPGAGGLGRGLAGLAGLCRLYLEPERPTTTFRAPIPNGPWAAA